MARITPAELPDDLPVKNNLVRATYLNPEIHRGFASLSGRVHTASRLSARVRELVVLRIAVILGSEYEWVHHSASALRAGVTEDELAALRRGDMDAFSGAEKAAILFAQAVEERKVDDRAWADARAHFSEAELADVAMLAGFYGLASRFVLALGVELEAPI